MIRNRLRSEFGRIFHLTALVAGVALVAGACQEADSREDTTAEATPARSLAPGTQLVFEVGEDLSTSSHRAGDSFSLRLAEEVTGSGDLVLPTGTPARGVVTAARPSEGPEDEGVLAVRIESVRIDGRDRALNGQVVSAETRGDTRDSGARSAGKVATGAAAGAILGQILGGDTRSTVGGAAVGAAAGLGVALTTRDGHAQLPEGSSVVVRLDDPLVVN